MFNSLPPVVKNLLIINVLMLIITYIVRSSFGIDLNDLLGFHYPLSDKFQPYQYVTYMFLHGDFFHLFFNMFALFMFGRVLEQVWGGKRFFVFYMVTGMGAIIVQTAVNYFEYKGMFDAAAIVLGNPTPESMDFFVNKHFNGYYNQVYEQLLSKWTDDPNNPLFIVQCKDFINQLTQLRLNIPTVGASGAVYGVLLGFGMLFPNTQLMLLIPPMPIKAKYMVIIYGLLELFLGISQSQSNVAHFAHLGGMLFGFFLIRYWNKNRRDNFY